MSVVSFPVICFPFLSVVSFPVICFPFLSVVSFPVICFLFLSAVSFPGQERSRHPTGGLAQALTAPHAFAGGLAQAFAVPHAICFCPMLSQVASSPRSRALSSSASSVLLGF
jgi:hypothetical protein